MTGPWLPAPRPALDDELQLERAVAAARTVSDRRAHEGRLSAVAAIGRLMDGDTA